MTGRQPLPGDIVLWQIGRCFAHGAIVVEWPRVLHANLRRPLGYANVDEAAFLNFMDRGKPRPRKFFCLKGWMAGEGRGERARLVECAKAWIGTPYHTGGRLRGVGADCITWIAGAFEDAGLVPRIAIPHYPLDWNLHRDEERYLNGLEDWCVEVPGP